ncbi:MAG: cysteine desulfurase-like protein [Planctomycetaceae bacterium]|nr:cysteine desulfurase-like protein [Planctomycetaceae bacterium]
MLDVETIRGRFPALGRRKNGQSVAYFDGPAGSQVPESVAEAVAWYLLHTNANCGAPFATSRETDATLASARRAMSDLLGNDDPDEIAFGPNMTTLTFSVSRTLSQNWQPGDEIIVSRLDHDANFTPWVLAAERAGATVRFIDVHSEDCTLDQESYTNALSEKTRLVAIGLASNAAGTINPVAKMAEQAQSVGALVYVDAVHAAPHQRMDVRSLRCDFLVCSAYKFFGPHVGILWGKRELLETLLPDKLRPAPMSVPGKWMTGTQNHEGIAGVEAAVDYLAAIGGSPDEAPRRERLNRAFEEIGRHERQLSDHFLRGLLGLPQFQVWGITDGSRLGERVPTFSLTHSSKTPRELSEQLAEQGLFTWSGNHYALPFTETLGLEPNGTLRVGCLHYNTIEEVDRLLESLRAIGASPRRHA